MVCTNFCDDEGCEESAVGNSRNNFPTIYCCAFSSNGVTSILYDCSTNVNGRQKFKFEDPST